MYLSTFRSFHTGNVSAAVGDEGGWVQLGTPDLHQFISRPTWRDEATQALRDTTERLSENDVEMLVPIRTPSKILCCGLNYRDHIAETRRETPKFPTLFAKFADTLLAPSHDILVQQHQLLDWEAELVVVIGREVFRADRTTAAAAILGYTVANDISMRDWQKRTLQWLQGKVFDGTTPIGPRIVTADVLEPKDGLNIECTVNGVVVQKSSTRELLFDAAHLVQYISTFTRLSPGDMILTGTPGGVAMGMAEPRYLRDGDVITTTISGIGSLQNTVRFEQ